MCVCAKALFVWLLYVCTYVCDMSSCVRSSCVAQFVCCTCLYALHSLCVLYVFVCTHVCKVFSKLFLSFADLET